MFWALLPMIVFAQTGFVEKVQKSSEGWGKVSINQESRLTRLLNGDTVIVQEKKVEEKILLMGMRYEKKDFPRLYGLLFAIGVNTVMWNDGDEQMEIDLEKIVRKPDLSNVEPQKRPLINPTLQLSGIYFIQELRRPVPKEEHKNLRALEEEVIVNLRKSEFLIAMQKKGDEPDKVNIPYLKDKEGKILQPVFSDVLEFEKFAKGKRLRIAKVPFDKLPNVLIEQAEALVVNPMGFNLVLNRDQLKKIIG